MRRERNAIAVESVNMSMLRVNMVEELAKKYPIVEASIKKFQERRLAALGKKKDSVPTAHATGRTKSMANEAKKEAEVHPRVATHCASSDISRVLADRVGTDGYASAGGPAQEVRDKSKVPAATSTSEQAVRLTCSRA